MLDVFRNAQFASPCAIRKLPGGMGGRSVHLADTASYYYLSS
jgi:hypothetical protein